MNSNPVKHFLIVFAHMNPKSFNSAVRDRTVQAIKKNGHTVEVSDLYQMNFFPVAGKNDFKEVINGEQMNLLEEQQNSFKNNLYSDEVKTEMEKVKRADYLIFIFPLWWASVPAILKGWIDRVFSCDFAWGYSNTFHKGLMLGKRAAIFTSAGGDKGEYSIDGDQKASLETSLNHINRGTFAFCGFDVLPIHAIYEVEGCGEDERQKFLNEIDSIIANFGTADLLHKMSS